MSVCACRDEIILCALKRRSRRHFNQARPSKKKENGVGIKFDEGNSQITGARNERRLEKQGGAAPRTAAMQIKCHCYEVNFNLIRLPPGFGALRFVPPSAFKWNSHRSIRLRRSYICYMTHPLFCSPSPITKAFFFFFTPSLFSFGLRSFPCRGGN